jgi:integrase/recombinase XerD
MTWNAALQAFTDYLILERDRSPNTIAAYTSDLEKIKTIATSRLPAEWTTQQLRETLVRFSEEGLSARSQARLVSSIKAFYKFLLLEEVIAVNPASQLEAPRLGFSLPKTLSEKEIDAILAAIDRSTDEGERNYCMVEMLYATGMRVSELVTLTLPDLFLDEGFIRVLGKGNKERLIPVHASAIKILKQYLMLVRPHFQPHQKTTNAVFLSKRGKSLSRGMVFQIIRNHAVMAGIKKRVGPHTLRHAFASHLLQNGADLRVIQDLLGHESITTTEIYTHLDKKFVMDTVEKYHPFNFRGEN